MKNLDDVRFSFLVRAISLSLMLICMFVFISCSVAPKADLSASSFEGDAPFTVNFFNNSQNSDQFKWDFGDGSNPIMTNIDDSVSHSYTKAGKHTVSLTASRSGEFSEGDTNNIEIFVNSGPLANLKLEPPLLVVEVTKRQLFKPLFSDEFGNIPSNVEFEFILDGEVGQINRNGNFVAGRVAGTYSKSVKVVAFDGNVGLEAYSDVTVIPGPLEHLAIEPEEATVNVGQSQKFTVTAFDRYENTIDGLAYEFSANVNSGVMDSDGNYTAGTITGNCENCISVNVTDKSTTKSITASVIIKQ